MRTIVSGKTRALLLSLFLCGCGGGEETQQMSAEQLAELGARSAVFQGKDALALQSDTAALVLGQELFNARCAECHGTNAGESRRGAPDLIAGVFDYGDSVDAVRATITQGRHSVMPNHGNEIGEAELGTLVSYVEAMAGGEEMDLFKKVAEGLYANNCVACHGAEGRGNVALGVPDLTDAYWQHGNSMMNIRLTITRGSESQCPAYGTTLSGTEIELLTAYVLNLRTR